MGYRSQVAGCFSVDSFSSDNEQDRAKFKAMIGFIKLSRFWELWNTKENEDHFGWQDGAFVLYGADWKWYESFPDVQAWDQLWESMQKVEGISGYFCRVGEETDDIEEHNFGDDPCYEFFHTCSAISFDGNDFLGKRQSDDYEEEQGEQTQATPQEKSCGSSVADTTQA